MAYGGGTWLVQNKVLPGTYINFISKPRAELVFTDRGYAAIGVELDWGPTNEIFTVENGDFIEDSMKYFGYSYDNEKLKGLRDFYRYAQTGYIYRLNNNATKAVSAIANAKYGGIRGNDITISVLANVDDPTKFDVTTYVGGVKKNEQTVAGASELVGNDYVDFITTATLSTSAGITLSGGTNGAVTGSAHQEFLDLADSYFFNSITCVSETKEIKDLYIAFTKRMRDEVGAKFVCVVYNATDPDFEGVINVKNKTLDANWPEASAVYWVGGAQAQCPVNKSLTNRKYNGDFTLEVKETQTELKQAIDKGYFIFHKTGDTIRVLRDINSFISFTKYKNTDFSFAQVIRILDQIAIDISLLFNSRYLGSSQNREIDRNDLKRDIILHHETLETLGAIENFDPEKDITVERGLEKNAVLIQDYVQPVVAMEKLYMNVIVG